MIYWRSRHTLPEPFRGEWRSGFIPSPNQRLWRGTSPDIKLKEIFAKFDQRLDKFDQRLDKLEQKIDNVAKDVNDLKVSVAEGKAELRGDIKALNEKVDGLGKRLETTEFINRGILIGLIVAILGGFAKLFGLVGNP